MIEKLEKRQYNSVAVTGDYPGFITANGGYGSYNQIDIVVDQNNQAVKVNDIWYEDIDYVTVRTHADYDRVTTVGGDGYISVVIDASGSGGGYYTLQAAGAFFGGPGGEMVEMYGMFRTQFEGNGGNDTLYIEDCIDAVVNGGPGSDLLMAPQNGHRIVMDGGPSSQNDYDYLIGSDEDDFLTLQGEGYISAGGGNDVIRIANGRSNTISGDSGWDVAYIDSFVIDNVTDDVESVW